MSYLKSYLKYCEAFESHEMYQLWSAFGALSALVGRKVWVDCGYELVYCQLYVILVGPQGGGKTSAMIKAKHLMRDSGVVFSGESSSREGLVKEMAEQEKCFTYNGLPYSYAPMTVCVTELTEFLSVSGGGMINFVVDVWDQNFYDHKTRNKEPLVINNPYLTILACAVPELLTKYLQDDIISGGFSRRATFIYPPLVSKRIAWPNPDKELWKEVEKLYKRIGTITGEYQWEQDAKEFYIHWYEVEEKRRPPVDRILAGYYRSRHVLMLKLAMLIGLSEAGDLIMRKIYIIQALEFMKEMEVNLPRVFEGMGRNELNAIASRILELLQIATVPQMEKQIKALIWRHLPAQFGQQDKQLEEIFRHLATTNRVTRWKEDGKEFIALRGNEPLAVRQLLVRAQESKSDSGSAEHQPSAPSTSPVDSALQNLLNQQKPPSVS